MATSVPVESLLFQTEASLQGLQRIVVTPGPAQRTAPVVERACDIEAVRASGALADGDGPLRDGDRLFEFDRRDQNIAKIEQGRHELAVPGSKARFLDRKRVPRKREGLDQRPAAVREQRAHQIVRRGRHLQRVVLERRTQSVDVLASHGFRLLVQTCGEQDSHVARTAWRALLPR